jgi:hypothetical protein
MKPLIGLAALLGVTTGAFAQSPPKVAKSRPVQLKPRAPMGCKLVGTVRGAKIWAGDCIAAELPPEITQAPPPPPPSIPPTEKQ